MLFEEGVKGNMSLVPLSSRLSNRTAPNGRNGANFLIRMEYNG